MTDSAYAIFHCKKDDDWIVCRRDGKTETAEGLTFERFLGVADCPDEITATDVARAMEGRRRRRKGGA